LPKLSGKVRPLKRRAFQRLRTVGTIEGTSTLLLFFVAMPLKYLADKPMAVSIVGAIHGGLFLLYCAVLAHAMMVHGRHINWAIKFFVAALLPFGPFVVDKSLKHELDELPADE
jgi:integral membrane protein